MTFFKCFPVIEYFQRNREKTLCVHYKLFYTWLFMPSIEHLGRGRKLCKRKGKVWQVCRWTKY